MWKAAFCLQLATVGRFLADSPPPPSLRAPSNLSASFKDSIVVVYWNFTEPEDLNLERLKFVLTVEHDSNFSECRMVDSPERPFHYNLYFLEPETTYTVNVWATHPSWRDGPKATITFNTTTEDWPKPYMKNVTAARSQKFMDYTVSWYLNHEPVELSHFEIILCTKECETTLARFHDTNVTLPINFYTRFSLRVAAIYNVRAINKVRRESYLFNGFTDVGPPAKVQNITEFHQWGNKMKIDWLPPHPRNGPIDRYEVLVHDSRNPFSISGVNVTSGTSALLLAPAIESDLYKIEIRAVNVDSEGVEHKSDAAVFDQERIHFLQTVSAKVLKRILGMIRFKIVPEYPQEDIIYDVHSDVTGSLNLTKLSQDEFEGHDVGLFKKLVIPVRLCYPTKDRATHTCEGFHYLNMRSNVGAPSRVLDLKLHETDSGGFILSWRAPQVPNGPINKYKLTAVENDGSIPFEIFVQKTGYWLRFTETETLKSPRFGVAAVNIDLDDKSLEYMGEMIFISPRRRGGTVEITFKRSAGFALIFSVFALGLGKMLLDLSKCLGDSGGRRHDNRDGEHVGEGIDFDEFGEMNNEFGDVPQGHDGSRDQATRF